MALLMRGLATVLLTGCLATPGYDGTHYRCDSDGACPSGFSCFAGVCANTGPGRLVAFPATEFTMGCTVDVEHGCDSASWVTHSVHVDAFRIQDHEVTQAEYATCATCPAPESTNCVDLTANPDLPVCGLAWPAAQAFCQAKGMRLPTEAEWERAARSVFPDGPWPWGSGAPTCALGVDQDCGGNRRTDFDPTQVETAGLANLAGNVREWVSDFYSDTYYSQPAASDNPQGPPIGDPDKLDHKVTRGGSLRTPAKDLTVWRRVDSPQTDPTRDDTGVRCVAP